VACLNAHPCIHLEGLSKTRKKIAYSPETFNISILEYEDTRLRWNIGTHYPVT